MTVEELIVRLKKCNPKATVVSVSFEGLSYFELDTISGKSFTDFENQSLYCSRDREEIENAPLKDAKTIVLT